ncbi:MAG: hypothetical protein P4L87_20600 [Formivibrio sp.]|nr:hypothetical protein [Formivibrio sp.]
MHQNDIFMAWVAGLTKTGTEQEHVDKLVDVLDSLLSYPAAKNLPGHRDYALRLDAAKKAGFGVDDLTHTLIDLSIQLQHVPKHNSGEDKAKDLQRQLTKAQQMIRQYKAMLDEADSKGFWARIFGN